METAPKLLPRAPEGPKPAKATRCARAEVPSGSPSLPGHPQPFWERLDGEAWAGSTDCCHRLLSPTAVTPAAAGGLGTITCPGPDLTPRTDSTACAGSENRQDRAGTPGNLQQPTKSENTLVKPYKGNWHLGILPEHVKHCWKP